ncbi:hypothetical protein ACSTHE_05930, partial [Vibrio parahaemolyticus]
SIASVKLDPCASETSAKLSAKSSRLILNLRREPHWLVVRDERVNPASAGFFSAFKRAKVFIKDNIRASSHFNKPKKIIAKN